VSRFSCLIASLQLGDGLRMSHCRDAGMLSGVIPCLPVPFFDRFSELTIPLFRHILLHGWQCVRVHIQCHRDLAMPQNLLHYFGMNFHGKKNSCRKVLELKYWSAPYTTDQGFTPEPSISSSNLRCALLLPLQRRTRKNVVTPFLQ
jgi:hypothetical protein